MSIDGIVKMTNDGGQMEMTYDHDDCISFKESLLQWFKMEVSDKVII